MLSIAVAATVWERKRAEQRLRESEQQLKRHTTYLEQFVFAASHDLQEPLRQVGILQDCWASVIAEAEWTWTNGLPLSVKVFAA